jgi:hypothetical protein
LPGDFSASLDVNGLKIGVVGLNSTALQLTGGPFEGGLAVSARQLESVCDRAWFRDHAVSVLLTHQPESWLHARAKEDFEHSIHNGKNFAIHLHGHMHEADYEERRRRLGGIRRSQQGRSLCGLEYFDVVGGRKSRVELYGYSIGQIEVGAGGTRMRHWLRHAVKGPPWRFDRDTVVPADGRAHHTAWIPLAGPAKQAAGSTQAKVASAPTVDIPDTGTLPAMPEGRRFLGRRGMLSDLGDFVRQLSSARNVVQLRWYYGFGGLGKSELLRTFCRTTQQANPDVRIGLIDFDPRQREFHEPVGEHFFHHSELLDVIAWRVRQDERHARGEARVAGRAHDPCHRVRDHREPQDHVQWLLDEAARASWPPLARAHAQVLCGLARSELRSDEAMGCSRAQ